MLRHVLVYLKPREFTSRFKKPEILVISLPKRSKRTRRSLRSCVLIYLCPLGIREGFVTGGAPAVGSAKGSIEQGPGQTLLKIVLSDSSAGPIPLLENHAQSLVPCLLGTSKL